MLRRLFGRTSKNKNPCSSSTWYTEENTAEPDEFHEGENTDVPQTTLHFNERHNDFLLVAAIDFGTTYSGYAFSFREDPLKIYTNNVWHAGSEQLSSLKAPTSILLTPDKEFHSFGYEAEDKYAILAEDKEHRDWFLFKQFKMLLHNNQGLTREATIEDITGKTMPALTVFSMAIGYLRGALLNHVCNTRIGITEADIKYVLTVPAIWSDKAKQFMREAGIKAGIDNERLMLALEPEAASIWCQTITKQAGETLENQGAKHIDIATGTQYMVVDLGGGTADISVHEMRPNGRLKELQKASGGPWGGTKVDKNYIEWLSTVFGKPAIEHLKQNELSDFFDIIRNFEIKKRTVKNAQNEKLVFRLPYSLRILHDSEDGSVKKRLETSELCGKVSIKQDKLLVAVSVVLDWFKRPIELVTDHIKSILSGSSMSNIKIVLLVGGFSECKMVQEEIRKQLAQRQIIVPVEPGLAVLKGAVRFGHMPDFVSTRIACCSYGIAARMPFDPSIHPPCRKLTDGDNKAEFVNDTFCVYVRKDDEIDTGHEVKYFFHQPNETVTTTSIAIYSSDQKNPMFVDEPGCQKLGNLKIHNKKDREMEVTLYFGDTELHVDVILLQSNRTFRTVIDCL